MIHPLAGLLSPRRIVVFGGDDVAASLWQTAAANNVEALAVDPLSQAANSISSLQSAPWQPEIAFITENSRQALVECSYAHVPAAVVCGNDTDSLNTPASVRVLHVGAGHFARPHYHISLGENDLLAGKVALLSNVELVADALTSQLSQYGVGLSFYVAIAPGSDVQLDDLLGLLEQDEHSEVIGLYLQEPAKPRMLLDTLARITPEKPVVALLPASDRTGTWNALLQYAGVATVHSLVDFGRVISAFNAPRHRGGWQSTKTVSTVNRPQDWRYVSALRHLSGIDPARTVVEIDAASPSLNSVDERCIYVSKGGLHPFATRLTGPSAATHTAWQHATKSTQALPELPKDTLRQELGSMPTGQLVGLPYLQPLLSQAGVPMFDGLWLNESQAADLQIRELGQPVDAWLVQGDGQAVVYHHISLEKLRRLQRRAERVWLQAAPQSGVEVFVRAFRHPQFGPIISCRPNLLSNKDGGLDYALPLGGSKADILAARLLPSHLANRQSLASTLTTLGHLFTDVPELQKLDATVACTPDQSRVADAQLEWMP